jgi:hypothetical protein
LGATDMDNSVSLSVVKLRNQLLWMKKLQESTFISNF